MADKKLLTLFNRCDFDDEERRLFDGALVSRVAANTELRMLKAEIVFDSYVSPSVFSHFIDKVLSAYSLTSFDCKYRFEGVHFCTDLWQDLVSEVKTRAPAANGFLNDSFVDLENGIAKVTLCHA